MFFISCILCRYHFIWIHSMETKMNILIKIKNKIYYNGYYKLSFMSVSFYFYTQHGNKHEYF